MPELKRRLYEWHCKRCLFWDGSFGVGDARQMEPHLSITAVAALYTTAHQASYAI